MFVALALNVARVDEKLRSLRMGGIKTVTYIVLLGASLVFISYIFGEPPFEGTPPFLEPYSNIIMFALPALVYIKAALVLIFGYLVLNTVSGLVYTYMLRLTDHPTASAIKSVTRVSGVALLLGLLSSIFNVNPAAALTLGSFGGLVVGFATQTILSHVVAGVFLLLARPFAIGDKLTVAGQTGEVKEIRLMHLVLETEDREILIPSGTVVTQILQKAKPKKTPKPVPTVLVLNPLPESAEPGSTIRFTGKLTEAETGKPVPNVTVKILEKDIMRDDLLVSTVTEADGQFNAEWKAARTDLDDTVEVYAKFEGNEDYRRSQTKQYVIKIAKQTESA
ncbi:MAG: hypothetical protein DRN29_10845 [Thermoplasmata archaeon]|nr:MAG: hypothetical protein DRN29_10845 [Thermoplasmata archaeon]